MNPFTYGQVVTDTDYCPRLELEKELKSRLISGQNTYIEGERRTGKTSLIRECVAQIKKKHLVYIDLFEVRNIEDVIARILNGAANLSIGFLQELLKKTAALRPAITMDPISGMPAISISGIPKYRPESLQGIMDLFSGREFRQVVAVFDEFQDIRNLEDSEQVLAIMRGKIQFQKAILYVFCGSNRSGMHSIFTDHESPFFKSALPLDVGAIDRSHFTRFLIQKFRQVKIKISPDTVSRILDITKDNPGDAQQLCSALVEVSTDNTQIEEDTLTKALQRIFAAERKGYETSLARITGIQMKCLRALAKNGGKNTMSQDFILSSGVTNPSTIKKSLNRLEEFKILFYANGEYKFTNPFFARWLVYSNY